MIRKSLIRPVPIRYQMIVTISNQDKTCMQLRIECITLFSRTKIGVADYLLLKQAQMKHHFPLNVNRHSYAK